MKKSKIIKGLYSSLLGSSVIIGSGVATTLTQRNSNIKTNLEPVINGQVQFLTNNNQQNEIMSRIVSLNNNIVRFQNFYNQNLVEPSLEVQKFIIDEFTKINQRVAPKDYKIVQYSLLHQFYNFLLFFKSSSNSNLDKENWIEFAGTAPSVIDMAKDIFHPNALLDSNHFYAPFPVNNNKIEAFGSFIPAVSYDYQTKALDKNIFPNTLNTIKIFEDCFINGTNSTFIKNNIQPVFKYFSKDYIENIKTKILGEYNALKKEVNLNVQKSNEWAILTNNIDWLNSFSYQNIQWFAPIQDMITMHDWLVKERDLGHHYGLFFMKAYVPFKTINTVDATTGFSQKYDEMRSLLWNFAPSNELLTQQRNLINEIIDIDLTKINNNLNEYKKILNSIDETTNIIQSNINKLVEFNEVKQTIDLMQQKIITLIKGIQQSILEIKNCFVPYKEKYLNIIAQYNQTFQDLKKVIAKFNNDIQPFLNLMSWETNNLFDLPFSPEQINQLKQNGFTDNMINNLNASSPSLFSLENNTIKEWTNQSIMNQWIDVYLKGMKTFNDLGLKTFYKVNKDWNGLFTQTPLGKIIENVFDDTFNWTKENLLKNISGKMGVEWNEYFPDITPKPIKEYDNFVYQKWFVKRFYEQSNMTNMEFVKFLTNQKTTIYDFFNEILQITYRNALYDINYYIEKPISLNLNNLNELVNNTNNKVNEVNELVLNRENEFNSNNNSSITNSDSNINNIINQQNDWVKPTFITIGIVSLIIISSIVAFTIKKRKNHNNK